MSDCIFCKIAAGDIQAAKVYEDAEVVAFLDQHPTQPGHTLVIPKAHYDRLDTTPPELVAKLFQVVRALAPGVTQAMAAQGFNVSVNTGLAAGQIIFHTHVHIVPRTKGDGLLPWGHRDYQGSEQEETAKKIRLALKSVSAVL